MAASPSRSRASRRRRAAAVLLLAAAAFAAVLLFLQSAPFEGWLRHRVQAALSAATGLDARIGRLDVALFPLRVTLGDARLAGPGGDLLVVPEVRARVRATALLRGDLHLESLEVESASLVLDASAPPTLPPPAPGGREVRIERFRLRDGTVLVKDPSRGVFLAARGVGARSGLFLSGRRIRADVVAARVRASVSGRRIQGASFRAGLDFSEGTLSLRRVRLEHPEAGSLAGQVRAEIGPPGGVAYHADLVLRARLRPLAGLAGLDPSSLPRGEVAARGTVDGRGTDWRFQGPVEAPDLALPGLDGPLSARAWLDAGPEEATLSGIEVRGLGGDLSGRASLGREESGWSLSLDLRARDLSTSALPLPSGLRASLPPLASRLGASFQGSLPLGDPRAVEGRWTVTLARPSSPPPAASIAPEASARGTLARGRIGVEAGSLTVAGLRAEVEGTAGLDGALDLRVDLRGRDLTETWRSLDLGARLPPEVAAGAEPSGSVRLHGRLRGDLSAPLIAVRLEGRDLGAGGVAVGAAEASIRYDEGRVEVRDARIQGPLADLEAGGTWDLRDSSRTRFRWNARSVDLAAGAALLGREGWAGGTLGGSGEVRVRNGSPVLEANLEGRDVRLAGGVTVDGLSASILAGADGLRVERGEILLASGSLRAAGSLPWTGEGGRIRLEAVGLPVGRLAGRDDVSGALHFEGDIAGSLASPRPVEAWTFGAEGLSFRGGPAVAVAGRLLARPEGLDLVLDADAGVLGGEVRIGAGGDHPLSATLRLSGLVLPLYRTSDERPVQLRLSGAVLRLEGPVARPEEWTGSLDADRADLRSGEEVLVRSRGALEAVLDHGRLRLEPALLESAGQEVRLAGRAEWGDPPIYSLSLHGTCRLEDLPALLGRKARAAGLASLDAEIAGAGAELSATGNLEVEGGYLRVPEFPQSLGEVSARLVFGPGSLRLERFAGRIGGGTVQGSGEAEIHGLRPGQWGIRLHGEEVGIRYPEGVQTLSDFDLEMNGGPDSAALSGRIRLAHARYTREMELESSLLRRTSVVQGPGPESLLDRLRLDLQVTADGGVWLDNDLARVEARTQMEVLGTAARPVLSGVVEAVQPGRITFNGVRYTLTDAVLRYSPARANDPDLSLEGETALGGYDIRIHVIGSLSDPRITFSSEPDLPPEQIVAVLATRGAWTPSGGPAGYAPGLVADYLAGKLGPVQQEVARSTRLDVFQVDPVFVEGGGDPTARVTLGKRLTPRLTATYSTLLGESQGGSVELRLRVMPHLELREARSDGGSTLTEARYTRSLNTGPRSAPAAERDGGEGSVLESVTLTGAPDPPGTEALRQAMALENGARASRSDVLSAVARARTILARSGRPLARIECRPPLEGSAGAPVALICDVAPGPLVDLEIAGVGPKQAKALREKIGEDWAEIAFPDELAGTAASSVESWYRVRGRARVEVQGTLEETEEGMRVRLGVVPGPRVRVARVRLEGVEAQDEDQVRGALSSAIRLLGRGPFLTPDLLDEDRRAIETLYFKEGHLDVRVEEPRVAYPDGPDKGVVTFSVSEGPRYATGEVTFSGAEIFREDELRARLGDAASGTVKPAALEDFARRLEVIYDRRGHPDADVQWELHREPVAQTEGRPVADVAFRVREGPSVEVRGIRLEGNRRTRDEVILREVSLHRGDPFSREEALESGRRLSDLGLFRAVDVRGEAVQGEPGLRDVLLRVRERDNLEIAGGAGFDDEEGAILSFSIGDRNLGGRNASLGLQMRWGGADRNGQLLAGVKRWRGSRTDLLGSLSYGEEDRPGFSVRRAGLSAQASRPTGPHGRVQLRYRIQDVALRDLADPDSLADEDEGVLAGIGGGYARDTRDDLFNPTRGSLLSADLAVDHAIFGSDAGFVRAFSRYARYWRLGDGGLVYGVSARVGAGRALTGAFPRSERFYAGGVGSVRGYGQDRLGPVDPTTGQRGGGEAVLVLNQELRCPVGRRFTAIAFLDAGNVYDRLGAFDPFDLKPAAGPGLEISTPAGPLRFYYGWKLRPEPDEDTARFHFTFGPSF